MFSHKIPILIAHTYILFSLNYFISALSDRLTFFFDVFVTLVTLGILSFSLLLQIETASEQ